MKARLVLPVIAWGVAANVGTVRADGPPPESAQEWRAPAQQPATYPVAEMSACQNGCDAPGRGGDRFWASAEYLLWWMKGAPLPPLITTSPAGTPLSAAGVIGAPGTTVLFGDSNVNDRARSGGRFTAGYWFDDCRHVGVEVGFFMLETLGSGFGANSDGGLILARPFFDVTTGLPSSQLIGLPGVVTGSVNATESSTGLLGADALLRLNVCCRCNSRLDVVGGYRFLRLADRVEVMENLVAGGAGALPAGTTLAVTDRFETVNEFHSFDLGLRGEYRQGPWVLAGRVDVAFGDNHETSDVSGITTATAPGFPAVTNPGGLLALQSNIGRTTRDRFEVVPEAGVRLGYQITPRLQAYAGYNFIYWDRVLRAGDQIDLAINPNLLPPATLPVAGPLRPAPRLDSTSIWIQGVDFGLQFNF